MAGILTLQEVKRACWKDAQRLKNLHGDVYKRQLCVLLALVAALSLTMVTAFAEELPVERATENSATVSDEVDTADNSDPHTVSYTHLGSGTPTNTGCRGR